MNIIEAFTKLKLGKKVKRKEWISYLKDLDNLPIPYWYDENFKKELYADLTLEVDDYLADDWEVVK